jgi:hypothetical protein
MVALPNCSLLNLLSSSADSTWSVMFDLIELKKQQHIAFAATIQLLSVSPFLLCNYPGTYAMAIQTNFQDSALA